MSGSRVPYLCLMIGLLAAASCRDRGRGEPSLSREVDAWLHCEECIDGEREAVLTRGGGVVAELRHALLSGPTPARRSEMQREYEIAYRTLGGAASSNRDDYVQVLLDNYVATYQKRAAISLADIGGADAREALRQALEPGQAVRYRDDVRTVIRIGYTAISGQWFGGTITPAAPGFGDTVTIRPAAGQSFNGWELLHLEGALYPDTAVRTVVRPDLVRFVVTAAEGQRLLTVHAGPPRDTAYTTIVVRTLADPNDRLLAHCSDLACLRDSAPRVLNDSGAVSLFLSLWRRPSDADTVDVFRFEPSRALRVTAAVDWRPGGEIDLRWISCADKALLADSAWTSGGRWRATRVFLPGRSCALLEVVLASRDQRIVAARLQLRATRLGDGARSFVDPVPPDRSRVEGEEVPWPAQPVVPPPPVPQPVVPPPPVPPPVIRPPPAGPAGKPPLTVPESLPQLRPTDSLIDRVRDRIRFPANTVQVKPRPIP